MSLSPGTRLGTYEIIAPIGAGGMGEVYRAKDTRLGREVAIKVLPEALAENTERLARFEREAKVLASLNHTHIAQIYGVEEHALVMELVPGQPLRGPLPLATAVNYAGQIAEALEAAHEKGIIHRDLKPANIVVTGDDSVKVLDFGLAAVSEGQGALSGSLADSPTITFSPTSTGMILGTAAYMSPEQARGKTVDRRADIWAFGVVFYEMLTGQPLFRGETVSDIMVEILSKEPDLSAIPAPARYVIERCLRKDPRKRWQAIGDVRIALEEGAGPQTPSAPVAEARRSRLPWAMAGVLLVVAAATSAIAWRAARTHSRSGDLPLIRLDADLGPDAVTTAYAAGIAAISPDGLRIVYPVRGRDGKQMLASRLLDKPTETVIAGTENGFNPFFSPDSKSIGFFADGSLKKVALSGGVVAILAEASNPRGGSWSEDGSIVAALTNTSGLSRIAAAGGSPPQPLTQLREGEVTHRWPQVLPGGAGVLFTASHNVSNYEDATLEIVNARGERRVLQTGGFFGRYADGYLLYVREGMLLAMAMPGLSGKPQGSPVQILDDVAISSTSAAGEYDVSKTGILLYHRGKAAPESWLIVETDSKGSGKAQPQLSKRAPYFTPRFSPDGRRLALSIETKGVDIYSYDLQNDVLSRLTFRNELAYNPVWTPDGKHIVFQLVSTSGQSLVWIRSDGAGDAQTLLAGKSPMMPRSISPDGRYLAYEQAGSSGLDVWTVALDLSDPEHPKAGKPEAFAHTPANEAQPVFSPDGRWLAFTSDESGVYEIYVRPFPDRGEGGKWQISSAGGKLPVWTRDGKRLFFENLDNRIMVVGYAVSGQSFAANKPRLWSDQRLNAPTSDSNFDVAPDGEKIEWLVRPPAEDAKTTVHVTFLLNFFDELRRRISQSSN